MPRRRYLLASQLVLWHFPFLKRCWSCGAKGHACLFLEELSFNHHGSPAMTVSEKILQIHQSEVFECSASLFHRALPRFIHPFHLHKSNSVRLSLGGLQRTMGCPCKTSLLCHGLLSSGSQQPLYPFPRRCIDWAYSRGSWLREDYSKLCARRRRFQSCAGVFRCLVLGFEQSSWSNQQSLSHYRP